MQGRSYLPGSLSSKGLSALWEAFHLINRGGKNEERLYLQDAKLDSDEGVVIVKKTDMLDMGNVIARHLARYHFVATFCRPKMKVLDFPCGSGYGNEVLKELYIDYEGRDNDEITIDYARKFYKGFFTFGDLTNPDLGENKYDVIACIEGIEHIENKHQLPLMQAFRKALKSRGVLIVTSPERGEVITNPYHKWELTKNELESYLKMTFQDRQILMVKDVDHKGKPTTFMYGVGRKE